MPYKDPEKQRAAQRAYYAANREKYTELSRNHRRKIAEVISEAKNVPCMDCGIKYPSYVMDFDHRDPSTKEYEISRIARTKSSKNLLIEMEKCDVVCSNCHRIRTFSRNQ